MCDEIETTFHLIFYFPTSRFCWWFATEELAWDKNPMGFDDIFRLDLSKEGFGSNLGYELIGAFLGYIWMSRSVPVFNNTLSTSPFDIIFK